MCSNIQNVTTCEVYIPQLLFQCNNTSLLINYCYIYINKMKTVFVIQIVQLVMRTKFDSYHLVDASPDGLLVSDCIIRSVVSASAPAWLNRYIYY